MSAEFAQQVVRERRRLALVDPAGEAEAVHPIDPLLGEWDLAGSLARGGYASEAELLGESAGMTAMSRVERRRVDWLWPGYVPLGKLTILDGDPGLGKSTLLIDFAARGSRGDHTPTGDPLEPFTSIIVTGEDDVADTIGPRLDAAKADSAKVWHLAKLTLPEEAGRLDVMISAVSARLVIVDPLMAHIHERVKTAVDHEVRRALEPLADLAEKHGCAIVAARHLNKRDGDAAMYRGGGSIAFTGLARSVLAVGRDPDDDERVILAVVKSNLARKPSSLAYRLTSTGDYDPAWVEWEGVSTHDAEALIGKGREEAREQTKTAKLAEAMRSVVLLNGGSILAKDGYRALEAEWADDLTSENLKTRARRKAGIRTESRGLGQFWWVLVDRGDG